MPRLVGKRSSNGGLYAVLLLLIAVGTAGALEYQGLVDVVPSFGKDYPGEPGARGNGEPGTAEAPQSDVQNSSQSIPQNSSQNVPQSATQSEPQSAPAGQSAPAAQPAQPSPQ